MQAFGWIVLVVLIVGVGVGVWLLSKPSPWDEIGADGLVDQTAAGAAPSRHDDEADLRALIERKRAARLARGERTAGDERRLTATPWSHIEPELIAEARELVARRRARLERTGQPVPDEHAELARILGPPHA